MAHGDERLPDEAAACFARLVERRFGGEPIQYIAGEAEFYGLPFRVGPAVLIPRPETEHLVEKVLALAARFPAPRLVDVGTGSGAIPIALARYLPEAVITSIDLSPAALQVARQNAELNEVVDRIRFLEGDLLGAVAREQFEIVVSNPPYVPLTDRASLAVEVREHEPGLALFAGDDGLAAYRRLIPEAFAALVAGGYVVLEIGYGQQAAIRTLLDAGGLVEIEFHPDLQGIARVACGKKPHRG
jgi:release factor glutamine methyltransferase